jgi:hypothetical protein
MYHLGYSLTIAVLSSNRDEVAHEIENIYSLALYRKNLLIPGN